MQQATRRQDIMPAWEVFAERRPLAIALGEPSFLRCTTEFRLPGYLRLYPSAQSEGPLQVACRLASASSEPEYLAPV